MKIHHLLLAGSLVAAAVIGAPLEADAATIGALASTNTTVDLTGQASASLAVVATASTSGAATVQVLGASGTVLASAKAKLAADATVTASYALHAQLGTVALVTVTPRLDGCVALAVSASGPVSGIVKAHVVSGGVSTVVQASVSTAVPGAVANVTVCVQL